MVGSPRLLHICTLASAVSGALLYEPFCTVLPKEMRDPICVSRRQLPTKPDGLPS